MSTQAHKTFVDACLAGEAFDSDIDGFVEWWHLNEDSRSLAEFLGFSDEEYATWVERPESLRAILFAKKKGIGLAKALQFIAGTHELAARGSGDEAKALLEWLTQTKRIA